MTIKQYFHHSLLFFSALDILFIPIDYELIPFQKWIGLSIGATSDSDAMWYLILVLMSISFFVILLIPTSKKDKVKTLIYSLIYWYLSLQLMRYGANKLFKWQFYLPEPNILYTRFGKLDQDIRYWSTMGTSYSYSVFMGIAEIIPAILLLIPKTRLVGLLISVGVFTNVLAVNIGFEIEVKGLSSFLLLLSLIGLIPYRKRLAVLFGNSNTDKIPPLSFNVENTPFWKRFIQTLGIVFIFAETLYPYIQSNNWNDDLAPRPFLHGAYKNIPQTTERPTYNYVFFHRKGYLILQDSAENNIDFNMQVFPKQHTIILTDYKQRQKRIRYQLTKKNTLTLYELTKKPLVFQKLDVKKSKNKSY